MGFGGTSTTTSGTNYPDYVADTQKRLIEGADTAIGPYLENPTAQIAPLGPDYDAINAGARGLFNNASGSDYSGRMEGMIGSGERAIPVAANYAQTGADDIMALANPYREAMTDVVVDDINQSRDRSAAQNAGQAARRSAFGGSGEAIRAAELDKNTAEQISDASTRIASDSYGQGANIAQNNTALKNAALDRTVNAMLQSTGLDMSAIQGADQLSSNYTNRNLAAGGFLGSTADITRAYEQALLDKDYTTFGRLAGLIPGVSGEQYQTTPVNNNGLWGAALGLGGTLLRNQTGFGG